MNKTWEEKTKALDFFLEKAENGTSASKENINLMELVADTDVLPRIIWDREANIIYANDIFLSKTGYELKDIVGKSIFNFITNDTKNASMEVVETNAKSGSKMVKGIINKWDNPKGGEPLTIDWHLGFNDNCSKLGSTQCTILTWNSKGEPLCTKCSKII